MAAVELDSLQYSGDNDGCTARWRHL